VSERLRDVTPLPDLVHGRSRSGPVRERRPLYVDLLPPCNAGCPAGENIQAWLALTKAGRHEEAWRQLVADNPLPAIHGRVCYHPCESVCNRAELDSAVSIHSVERFLGDRATEQGWEFDPPAERTGKHRGTDLLDGTVTLPLILARERSEALADLDLRAVRTPEQAEGVCDAIAATGALVTNFHLPGSTLLMLVAAFAGFDAVRAAYQHAIERGYRFYSYGDAMLVWPAPAARAPEACA